ncbi:hypothetical protein QM565_00195 [Geitlerinema splendidum]|nr:hypothetical protein [Geitlerinema splendidum]
MELSASIPAEGDSGCCSERISSPGIVSELPSSTLASGVSKASAISELSSTMGSGVSETSSLGRVSELPSSTMGFLEFQRYPL